jgi:1-acyl-sn-glycerol-3-phosphate acyltransferase
MPDNRHAFLFTPSPRLRVTPSPPHPVTPSPSLHVSAPAAHGLVFSYRISPMPTTDSRSNRAFELGARLLISVLGWIFFFISSAILFPVAVVIWLVTLPFDRNLVIQHIFTCLWATMYVWVHPGWKLKIEGREKLPWKGAAIMVVNHQSQVDILVAFALLRPYKPVSKAVVRWVPFIGWNMMMNRYIALARGERKSVARMAQDCRYWLRRGMPVMIYPEGTRSPDGQIKEFKNGAFTLAVQENCPVYPVIFDGTRDALPKNSLLLSLQANLRARVLDPIFPDSPEFGDAACRPRERAGALRDRVRDVMVRELARMRGDEAVPTNQIA